MVKFTKLMTKVTDYTSIRMIYDNNNGNISFHLDIGRRNKKLEKSNHAESKQIIQKLKINGCAICGYNKCDAALDFHHVNPEDKKFLVNAAFVNGHSNEKIIDEVNKCILICANCHREIENE